MAQLRNVELRMRQAGRLREDALVVHLRAALDRRRGTRRCRSLGSARPVLLEPPNTAPFWSMVLPTRPFLNVTLAAPCSSGHGAVRRGAVGVEVETVEGDVVRVAVQLADLVARHATERDRLRAGRDCLSPGRRRRGPRSPAGGRHVVGTLEGRARRGRRAHVRVGAARGDEEVRRAIRSRRRGRGWGRGRGGCRGRGGRRRRRSASGSGSGSAWRRCTHRPRRPAHRSGCCRRDPAPERRSRCRR